MPFDLDLCGIALTFEVQKFKTPPLEEQFSKWCNVDFRIRSGNWLNYHIDGELMMPGDIQMILTYIDALLDSGVAEPFHYECTEPDFQFTFHPKKDLRNNPRHIYIAPGHEIEDIELEWSVYFWNGRLPGNRLTLVLRRKEIIALQQYLKSVAE